MNEEAQYRLYKKRKCTFTKKLRRSMTPTEAILWEILRNRKFKGLKFRRQMNIGPYIVDFLCKEYKVALEIDGGIHDEEDQKESPEDPQADGEG